jgi:hypothetical protein
MADKIPSGLSRRTPRRMIMEMASFKPEEMRPEL